MKVGIAGSGFVAWLHVAGWRRVHGVDVEVAAVTSGHDDTARAFATEHGIPRVHASIETMCADSDIDVIDICVPNHLHAPFAMAALGATKHVIVEKPLTGAFVMRASVTAQAMLEGALHLADTLVATADAAQRWCCYAENWVYAPPVVKAAELVAVSNGAILRIQGEESHSGTHSEPNKHWVTAGGGALLGKGCHPLGAALMLKRDEGVRRTGQPIRPHSVIAVTRSLTKLATFEASATAIRTGYDDVEDFGLLVCTFDDGSIAEIVGADTTLGGVRNTMTVFATNTVVEANLNPNSAVRAYAPNADVLADAYISEKIETHAGWTQPSPDEDWMQGYPQELQDFAEAIVHDRAPRSDARLGRDVLAVIYGAYLSAEHGRAVDLSPYLRA